MPHSVPPPAHSRDRRRNRSVRNLWQGKGTETGPQKSKDSFRRRLPTPAAAYPARQAVPDRPLHWHGSVPPRLHPPCRMSLRSSLPFAWRCGGRSRYARHTLRSLPRPPGGHARLRQFPRGIPPAPAHSPSAPLPAYWMYQQKPAHYAPIRPIRRRYKETHHNSVSSGYPAASAHSYALRRPAAAASLRLPPRRPAPGQNRTTEKWWQPPAAFRRAAALAPPRRSRPAPPTTLSKTNRTIFSWSIS